MCSYIITGVPKCLAISSSISLAIILPYRTTKCATNSEYLSLLTCEYHYSVSNSSFHAFPLLSPLIGLSLSVTIRLSFCITLISSNSKSYIPVLIT